MRTYMMYVLIVALTCYLCACGTKGPLYIPEQRYPQGAENNAPKNATEYALQANIHKPFRPALFVTVAA